MEQDPLAVSCREDSCQRSSFTESIEQVTPRARTTRRLRTQIGKAIGDAARSVAEVAASHGVSWPTAHRAFVAHADEQLTETEPTRVLGIDETHPSAAPRSRRLSSTWRSTRPPHTPRRSARPIWCPTRRSWSTTSTW